MLIQSIDVLSSTLLSGKGLASPSSCGWRISPAPCAAADAGAPLPERYMRTPGRRFARLARLPQGARDLRADGHEALGSLNRSGCGCPRGEPDAAGRVDSMRRPHRAA
ncbi:MAG TPA: hypothetical protein VIG88_03260 [Lysobacter sp.]